MANGPNSVSSSTALAASSSSRSLADNVVPSTPASVGGKLGKPNIGFACGAFASGAVANGVRLRLVKAGRSGSLAGSAGSGVTAVIRAKTGVTPAKNNNASPGLNPVWVPLRKSWLVVVVSDWSVFSSGRIAFHAGRASIAVVVSNSTGCSSGPGVDWTLIPEASVALPGAPGDSAMVKASLALAATPGLGR